MPSVVAGVCSRTRYGGFFVFTKGTFLGFLFVFLGAGLGGMARHGVNVAAARMIGMAFPFGTLTVNVVGGLLMGFVAEYWALRSGLSQSGRLFLTTGILGGFTTFSSFSLDAVYLWEKGQALFAIIYTAATVFLSISALFLGMWLVRAALGIFQP